MAILHKVNDFMKCIKKQYIATAENRSINIQVITLLRNALSAKRKQAEDNRQQNIAKLLEESRHRPRLNPADFGLPDSTDLITEDRNR